MREYELLSYVGRRKAGSVDWPLESERSECYSACTLAFLGGKFRFIAEGSKFGVHQFSFRSEVGDSVSVTQALSAEIVSYIRQMGVDTEFFRTTNKARADAIYLVSQSELQALNVTNGGVEKARWKIESSSDLIYLKGERDTVYGYQKILLICTPKATVVTAIFDPQNREDELISFPEHKLEIGQREFSIRPQAKQITNGMINISLILTKDHARLLNTATSLGVRVQMNRDASVFLGISSMPLDSDGKRLLNGYLKTCTANAR